jgi:hypothetical protein
MVPGFHFALNLFSMNILNTHPRHPNRLCRPPTLLFNGFRAYFAQGYNCWVVTFTSCYHLVPWLRNSEVINPVGKPRTKWEDVVWRVTSQILGTRGGGDEWKKKKNWGVFWVRPGPRRVCSTTDGWMQAIQFHIPIHIPSWPAQGQLDLVSNREYV